MGERGRNESESEYKCALWRYGGSTARGFPLGMAQGKYVVLLREVCNVDATASPPRAFDVMSQHAPESDAQLSILQQGTELMPAAQCPDRPPEKTQIITTTDPFVRTDQLNGSTSKTSAGVYFVIVAACGPFWHPWQSEKFARQWSASGRGVAAKLVQGSTLAECHNVPFYPDLLIDYDAPGVRADGDDDEDASVLDDEDDDDESASSMSI